MKKNVLFIGLAIFCVLFFACGQNVNAQCCAGFDKMEDAEDVQADDMESGDFSTKMGELASELKTELESEEVDKEKVDGILQEMVQTENAETE